MYISRLSIDRFGILAGQEASPLSPGLTVFLGRNEAGKSTCLRFLQSMLFGYRRGKRNLDSFPARGRLGAGNGGGTLFLESAAMGPLTLTRRPGVHGGPLTFASAAGELGEADLARLLGGLSADVFDNIFAFSIRQLMDFSSLSGESVRHALHGAAFGLGLTSPAKVLKQLDDNMAALLKREPANAAINAALRELDAIRAEQKARTPSLEAYAELQGQIDQAEKHFSHVALARKEAEQRLRAVHRLKDLWAQAAEVRRVRERLSEAEAEAKNNAQAGHEATGNETAVESSAPSLAPHIAPRIAPDAVHRLDALLAQREERNLAVVAAKNAHARLAEELSLLDTTLPENAVGHANEETRLAELANALQTLREQKGRRSDDVEALHTLFSDKQRLSGERMRLANSAGHAWDEAALMRLADEAHTTDMEERIAAFAESLAQKEQRAALAQSQWRQAEAECAELSHAAAGTMPGAAVGESSPALPTPAPLPENAIARLSLALASAREAVTALPDAQFQVQEAQRATADAAASLGAGWTPEHLAALEPESTRPALEAAAARVLEACADVAATKNTALAAEKNRSQHADECAAALQGLEARLCLITEAWRPNSTDEASFQAAEDALTAASALLARLRRTAALLAAAKSAAPLKNSTAKKAAPDNKAAATERGTAPGAFSGMAACLEKSPVLLAGVQLTAMGGAGLAGGYFASSDAALYAGAALCVPGALLCAAHAARPRPAHEALFAQAHQRFMEAEHQFTLLAQQASAWFTAPQAAEYAENDTDAMDDALERATRLLEQNGKRLALAQEEYARWQNTCAQLKSTESIAHNAHMAEKDAQQRLLMEQERWSLLCESLRLPFAPEPASLPEFFALARAARSAAASARAAEAALTTQKERLLALLKLAREYSIALPQAAPETPAAYEQCCDAVAAVLLTAEKAQAEAREQERHALLLAGKKDAAENAEKRAKQALAERTEAQEALRAEIEAWRAWCAGHISPTQPLSSDAAAALLKRAKTFASLCTDIAHITERENTIARNLAAFISETAAVAGKTGIALPPELEFFTPESISPPAVAEFSALATRAGNALDSAAAKVETALRGLAKRRDKMAQLSERESELTTAAAALNSTEEALASLLAACGVSDAEKLRSAFAAQQYRATLREQERTLLATLASFAGEDHVSPDEMIEELGNTNVEALAQEEREAEEELERLAAEEAQMARNSGALRERRAALMEDGEGARLLREEEALKEDLRSHSREWAVLALAKALVLGAKRRFEEEGNEGVIRHAGELFSAFTGNEYAGIAASFEGEDYTALHSSGVRKDPEKELSQGTREQLYLALRLAYVKNHASKAEAVPLIMDDILVNFDPERARHTAQALAAFAAGDLTDGAFGDAFGGNLAGILPGGNQIIFFTCHPHTAAMLIDAAAQHGTGPKAALFGIAGGQICPLSRKEIRATAG